MTRLPKNQLLVLCLAALLGCATAAPADDPKPGETADPLPAGARLRLGIGRFRHEAAVTKIFALPDARAPADHCPGHEGPRLGYCQRQAARSDRSHPRRTTHEPGLLRVARRQDAGGGQRPGQHHPHLHPGRRQGKSRVRCGPSRPGLARSGILVGWQDAGQFASRSHFPHLGRCHGEGAAHARPGGQSEHRRCVQGPRPLVTRRQSPGRHGRLVRATFWMPRTARNCVGSADTTAR